MVGWKDLLLFLWLKKLIGLTVRLNATHHQHSMDSLMSFRLYSCQKIS